MGQPHEERPPRVHRPRREADRLVGQVVGEELGVVLEDAVTRQCVVAPVVRTAVVGMEQQSVTTVNSLFSFGLFAALAGFGFGIWNTIIRMGNTGQSLGEFYFICQVPFPEDHYPPGQRKSGQICV